MRLRPITLSLSVVFLVGCSDRPEVTLIEWEQEDLRTEVGVRVSTLDAPVGRRIRVSVGVHTAQSLEAAALRGRVEFDSEALAYRGQILQQGVLALTHAHHDAVDVLAFRIQGLPSAAAVLEFEVLDSSYAKALGYEHESLVGLDASEIDVRVLTALEVWVPATDGPMRLDPTADELVGWAGYEPSRLGSTGRVISTAAVLGDCNVDLTVDAMDLVAIARIAVGLDEPPSDPSELRLCDPDGSESVDVLDVLDVSRFAVGVDPIRAPVGLQYRPLSGGGSQACALDESGAAHCWGFNSEGWLSVGSPLSFVDVPTPVVGGLSFVSIVSAANVSCGLEASGQAHCWGRDRGLGVLGSGSFEDSLTPVPVAGGHEFVQLSPGRQWHFCGLTRTGEAWCWGGGALGDGVSTAPQATPVQVAGGIAFKQIAASALSTCALDRSGQAFCWGADYEDTPDSVAVGHTFSQITAGGSFACGLDLSQRAWCWGSNRLGQLGDGSGLDAWDGVPVEVAGDLDFVRLEAGQNVTCGITEVGDAYCWGASANGQVGDGTVGELLCDSGEGLCRPTPVAVSEGGPYSAITVASQFTCGLNESRELWCWGLNTAGGLALGSDTPRRPMQLEPGVAVDGASFTQISAGESAVCGLPAGGAASCWGGGTSGELGRGSFEDSGEAMPVTGGLTFSSIDVGTATVCGVSQTDGYCWGSNRSGKLGGGSGADADVASPALVSGGHSFVSIEVGFNHACGLDSFGNVLCWGANDEGQLGDSTVIGTDADCSFDCRPEPDTVRTSVAFDRIWAGFRFNCGLDGAGAAYCWGRNAEGQLGVGDFTDRTTPTPVSGGLTFSELSVHPGFPAFVCGVTDTGDAYCWGDNRLGQLGNGTMDDANTPQLVSGGGTYTAIRVGESHACGRSGGSWLCWGDNRTGAIGDGTTDVRLVPTPVANSSAFVDIAAGVRRTCGVEAAGTVICWGSNVGGGLGLGSLPRSLSPLRSIQIGG